LAQRFQTYFPTLLPRTYNPNQIIFRRTDRQRTLATMQAFSDGLFGEGAWQTVQIPEPSNPDPLLRPHDDCPLYTSASNTEVVRGQWQNSAEFQAMLTRINDKLGLQGGQRLSARQTRTMWEICQFEQLWYPERVAPFCGAISPFDNVRLEYFDDIDEYYTSGYGLNPLRLGENLNCNILQDLLGFLTSNNPNEETVRVSAAHQTSLQLFLVGLGVFGNDPPLTPANFPQQSNREWNVSRLAPMASNIAVVRYK
jgi:multiple inositol-polyphosphate phosphatase/2,3-bisphosphoglycerate 3-phosphatase